jgi:hypothetical protein
VDLTGTTEVDSTGLEETGARVLKVKGVTEVSDFDGTGTTVAATGQTVVVVRIVEVLEPTGQFVTVCGQAVIVYSEVIYTTEVVYGVAFGVEVAIGDT